MAYSGDNLGGSADQSAATSVQKAGAEDWPAAYDGKGEAGMSIMTPVAGFANFIEGGPSPSDRKQWAF